MVKPVYLHCALGLDNLGLYRDKIELPTGPDIGTLYTWRNWEDEWPPIKRWIDLWILHAGIDS